MIVKVENKSKTHIIYKLDDGSKVPGVTTILQILAKPALIHWAWDLGCKGIDYRRERDNKADIGILAHLMIVDYLKDRKSDYSDYSKSDIDRAENCLLSFYEWLKHKELKPINIETQFVSNLYKFGGTIDCFCWLDGVPTLIDFKTSKALYDEMFYQVAAYKQLLNEHKKEVSNVMILRIGRDETEGFEDRRIIGLDNYWNIFFHCLEIYKLKKKGLLDD